MNYTTPKLLPQYTPLASFKAFSSFVLENQRRMTPQCFAQELGNIQKSYMRAKQRDLFCSEADMLADKLSEQKNNDFAGIIISAICKLTQFFPEQLEPFAQKGFIIAKANGDFIHMMSRLNDLRKIYYRNPNKLYKYLQVLYEQEKCLKVLSNNYDTAVNSYRTVNRHAANRVDYAQMLAHVQTELGKLIKRKHPEEAKEKLLSAREIFNSRGNTQHLGYINMLLREIG